jgi:hypothetical protein
MDFSRRTYSAPSGEAPGAMINPWTQALEFWSGFMAMPWDTREKAAPVGDAAAEPVSAFGQWADFWIKAQRSCWDAWFEAARGFPGPMTGKAEADADPWRRMLDFWSTLMPLRNDFTESLRAGRNPWAGLATFWGMPLDNWRRVCSAISVMPGDMEKAVREVGSPYGTESLHRTMVGFLSMPTVGYTREWQEELQRWSLLWLDHFEALREHGTALIEITLRAFELFGRALSEKAAGNEAPGSLRTFYDLWIDCCEEAYGEISISPGFVETQARLTNSLFAIKRQEQKMVEEIQSAFNMPTRRELDTSHRRVHQLQRRLWQMEQALEESGGPELREEMSALRREVEALRTSLETGGAKPAPSRKSGSKTTT